jgi:5-methylcytosine-specific restriction endonuclease McrA
MQITYPLRAHNFKDLAGQKIGRLTVLYLDQTRTETKIIYWWCRCDCGVEKAVAASNLGAGNKTVSCGCYRLERMRESRKVSPNRKTPAERGRQEVYRTYKRRAEKSGLVWGLSKEIVFRLFESSCHYCGAPPSNYFSTTKFRKRRRYTSRLKYSGIDRKDSNLGYIITNCVPCCAECNWAKNSTPYDEFIKWVTQVYKHLQK